MLSNCTGQSYLPRISNEFLLTRQRGLHTCIFRCNNLSDQYAHEGLYEGCTHSVRTSIHPETSAVSFSPLSYSLLPQVKQMCNASYSNHMHPSRIICGSGMQKILQPDGIHNWQTACTWIQISGLFCPTLIVISRLHVTPSMIRRGIIHAWCVNIRCLFVHIRD